MSKIDNKICVVGGGHWGKNHIRILNDLGYLGGIVDSRIETLNRFKQEYPNIYYFQDIEEALNENFLGYTIATPAESHYDIAKKIISNGNNVLVEKPITLNSSDAIDLVSIAKVKNVKLMVGHVLLFHPAFQKIKEYIKNGSIGKLQYLYSNRLNLGTIRTEENVFWSLAPHDIALFQYFTESYPNLITSSGLNVLQGGIHDTTITTLKYPNNIMGHIFVSWLHPFKEHRFVIVGSKGMLRFEDSHEEKPLLFYDKGVDWKAGIPIPRNGPTKKIEYNHQMPLTLELKYFLDSIIDNNKIAIADGESAMQVIEILEIATQSLKESNK